MSDTGRQDMGDKLSSSVKPESQKTMTEQATDKIKGVYDSVASSMQPESQKSTGQKVSDGVSGNSNQNSESVTDKAKGTMGL